MSRPRIRSLKPECWQDESVGALGRDARLLFVGLITLADDEGRLRAQPSMLIGSLFPWDEVAPRDVAKWLDEIAAERLIVRYLDAGKPYIAFRNWKRHQRINRPSPSLLPPPPDAKIVEANSVNEVPYNGADSVSDHGTGAVKNSAGFTTSLARGSDQEGKGTEEPAATPPGARAQEQTSRSMAETVKCPRCGSEPGTKCMGVRARRESCHLERHHAVGELTHLTVKNGNRRRPEREPRSPERRASEREHLQREAEFCSHFPGVHRSIVMAAVRAVNETGEPASVETVRAHLEAVAS